MTSRFAAAASALGYAYQLRYGLLRAVQRIRTDDRPWTVALEAADDLEFTGSTDGQLVQTKLRNRASLTDASPDFWKTIRVWATAIGAGDIDPKTTEFILVTTANLGSDTFLSELGPDGPNDPSTLLAGMKAVASSSKNDDLSPAFNALKALTPSHAQSLANNMRLIVEAPGIVDAETALQAECRIAVRAEHLDAYVERLEGWWFRRCLRQLVGAEGPISRDEIANALHELRDQFGPESLPIDPEYAVGDHVLRDFAGRTFIEQLELVGATSRQFVHAIRDYMRAFEQSSRWSRDGLLLADELEKYETILVREWEGIFEQVRSELGDATAEEEQRAAALRVYRWASIEAQIPIRPKCVEPFLTRGRLHHLADQLRVGWHPDFEARLAALLEPAREDA